MTLLATVAACIAALAAAWGLRYAAQAARAGRDAVRLAEEARQAAERDARRHRLERVAELVERIFWLAYAENRPFSECREALNLLPALLIGLEDDLPRCKALTEQGARQGIIATAGDARHELRAGLSAL